MPHAMSLAPSRAQSDFVTEVTQSVQRSALQPLTQGLRGEGDLWETLPLIFPFPNGPGQRHVAEMQYYHRFFITLLGNQCFTLTPEHASLMPPALLLGGGAHQKITKKRIENKVPKKTSKGLQNGAREGPKRAPKGPKELPGGSKKGPRVSLEHYFMRSETKEPNFLKTVLPL